MTACGGGGGSSGGGASSSSNSGVGGQQPTANSGLISSSESELQFGVYVGDAQSTAIGVRLRSDGDIIYALNTSSNFVSSPSVGSVKTGLIVRQDSTTDQYVSQFPLNAEVTDFALNSNNLIGFATATELGVVQADLSAIVWRQSRAAIHIALASNGHLASATNSDFEVRDAMGQVVWTLNHSATQIRDIAVDSNASLFLAVGFRQVSANLKLPFVQARDLTNGSLVWEQYNFSNSDAQNAGLLADSEGERISVSADGQILFAGRTDGGNTVFQRLPGDITTTANLFTPDNFQQPVALSGAAKFVFLSRVNPVNGQLVSGTFLIPRLTSGSQNTLLVFDIQGNSQGETVVVGHSRFALKDRNNIRVSGVTTTPAGTSMAVFDNQWNLLNWVSFATTDSGDLVGAAVNNAEIRLIVDQAPSQMVTVNSTNLSSTNVLRFGLARFACVKRPTWPWKLFTHS